MSNTKKRQWHSLGDFLQAKEERERARTEEQTTELKGDTQSTGVSTGVPTPVATPVLTPVTTPVATGVPERELDSQSQTKAAPSESQSDYESKDRQLYLDATHTASEQQIYSVMYRETVSKGQKERHFGFKELCAKTGIRSDRTIRRALDGLQEKLSVEIVSYLHGNPLGPRYRVYDPKEILKRRKVAGLEIDPQSKKIIGTGVSTGVATGVGTGVATGGKNYGSTPVESTPVTPVLSTGVYKYRNTYERASGLGEASSSNQYPRSDDEAFVEFVNLLREMTQEITGKQPTGAEAMKWRELAEVLVTELRIAAGRTTISSVPAFLAEHLRRRLWKLESWNQPASETSGATSLESTIPREEARNCPDCWGTGMYYPDGFEKGVAKCAHQKLHTSKTTLEATGIED
jgi:hypothetical protein